MTPNAYSNILKNMLENYFYTPILAILLFARGKLVCTGAVNEKMVYDAAEKLMNELIQKGLLIR